MSRKLFLLFEQRPFGSGQVRREDVGKIIRIVLYQEGSKGVSESEISKVLAEVIAANSAVATFSEIELMLDILRKKSRDNLQASKLTRALKRNLRFGDDFVTFLNDLRNLLEHSGECLNQSELDVFLQATRILNEETVLKFQANRELEASCPISLRVFQQYGVNLE